MHWSHCSLLVVETFLHFALNPVVGVLECSPIFNLDLLWHGEAVVHHVLVVLDHGHFTVEFGVEVVLTFRERVFLLDHRCRVTVTSFSETVTRLIINAKVIVECSLAVSWSVLNPQSTREVRNVRVTPASIVDVNNRL